MVKPLDESRMHSHEKKTDGKESWTHISNNRQGRISLNLGILYTWWNKREKNIQHTLSPWKNNPTNPHQEPLEITPQYDQDRSESLYKTPTQRPNFPPQATSPYPSSLSQNTTWWYVIATQLMTELTPYPWRG